jgi:acyl carrier protein phosphodiesterase
MVMGKLPGTVAVDLQKKLDTIRANVGFDRLQQMRDQSKTGGALGQVAIQELAMLQSVLGSLDREQSPKQLAHTLKQIDAHYTRVNTLLERINRGKSGGWSAVEVKP